MNPGPQTGNACTTVCRRTELFRALGALCERPDPAHAPIARALGLEGRADASDHSEVFVFQLPPYASIYLDAQGKLGGEAGGRVGGFWRAVGLTPPREPDHLAALLSLYATLDEAEEAESEPARRVLRREAKAALMWEHLLPWVPVYLLKMQIVAPGYFARWARLVLDLLLSEAPPPSTPRMLPLHLRCAPPRGLSDTTVGEVVDGLLTPVRSGILLTRWDLACAARATGMVLRMGERRFVLKAMLDQDAGATLECLRHLAQTEAQRHRELQPAIGAVASFWVRRAEATADSIGASLVALRHPARRA